MLRDADTPEPPRAPAPGLENTKELVDRARHTGLEIEYRITGEEPTRRAALQAETMIRVLVADDQAAVRDGFAALLDAQETMTVAAQASNGREAVDLARRTFPHVVLMDIRMPVLDGLEANRLICADQTLARTRVVVLTTFDVDEYVYTALRSGASGFLLKDTPRREFLLLVARGLNTARSPAAW